MYLAKVATAFTVVLGCWTLSSCLTEPKFSFVPRIDFREIRLIPTKGTGLLGNKGDSVIISIHFEDGDGNLGLTQEQIKDLSPWKEGQKNYVVKTLVKNGNIWELRKDNSGKLVDNSGYFFPLKLPTDKPGPIEGTLDYSMVFYPTTLLKDSIKFDIYIIDDKQNASAPITTTPVLIRR